MNVIDNLKIRTKLIGSFTIIIPAMVLIAILGVSGLTAVGQYSDDMFTKELLPVESLGKVVDETIKGMKVIKAKVGLDGHGVGRG